MHFVSLYPTTPITKTGLCVGVVVDQNTYRVTATKLNVMKLELNQSDFRA
ncbi:hypothetical protein OA501_02600 [Flavobacteriaceae bacterium]|nr:hypothetical protein [Flavobacteriaceae bacterium]